MQEQYPRQQRSDKGIPRMQERDIYRSVNSMDAGVSVGGNSFLF